MKGDKGSILILPVKPVIQANGYECGVACVQTILGTRGIKSNRLSLKGRLHTTKGYGTLPTKIREVLTLYGFKIKEKFEANLGDIESELGKGRLCLVAYQAWGAEKYYEKLQSGHYSVIFGIEKDYLWLADSFVKGKRVRYRPGVRKIKKELFEKRWRDEDGRQKLYERWYLAV